MMSFDRIIFTTLIAFMLGAVVPASALAKHGPKESSSITFQPSRQQQLPVFSVRYEGSISTVDSAWGGLAFGTYGGAVITNLSLGYRRYVSGDFSSGWFVSPFLSSVKIVAGSDSLTFNSFSATYGGKHIFKSGFTLEGALGLNISNQGLNAIGDVGMGWSF